MWSCFALENFDVVWGFFCVGFFFGFNLTNTNSECFFPRLTLGRSYSFARLLNPHCLWLEFRCDPGNAPPEFIFPRESPELGKSRCFVNSTTRGQPLPPSRVKNLPKSRIKGSSVCLKSLGDSAAVVTPAAGWFSMRDVQTVGLDDLKDAFQPKWFNYSMKYHSIILKKIKIIAGVQKRMPGATGALLKDRVESAPTPQTVTTESTGLKQTQWL